MSVKELKLSNYCIYQDKCKVKYSNETQIDVIDDETLLIKNAYNLSLNQNCDARNIVLSKNYLITFSNCSIQINNEIFSNKKEILHERYFYPNNKTNLSFV